MSACNAEACKYFVLVFKNIFLKKKKKKRNSNLLANNLKGNKSIIPTASFFLTEKGPNSKEQCVIKNISNKARTSDKNLQNIYIIKIIQLIINLANEF